MAGMRKHVHYATGCKEQLLLLVQSMLKLEFGQLWFHLIKVDQTLTQTHKQLHLANS